MSVSTNTGVDMACQWEHGLIGGVIQIECDCRTRLGHSAFQAKPKRGYWIQSPSRSKDGCNARNSDKRYAEQASTSKKVRY
ncbi:hypothetical protein Gpo141_00013803 [Globisporangium polare]